MSLYEHASHPHTPRNPNERHQSERLGVNARIAVFVARNVGTMLCAYVFAGIGVGSIVGVVTNNTLLALALGSLSSYFLQLVLLPVIMVGQNVQGRHGELMAEEMYHGVVRLLHENGEASKHLAAQDAELLKQTGYLVQLLASARPELLVVSPPGEPPVSPPSKRPKNGEAKKAS